ncbi:MAG: DUF3526 domain-containing protein [Pseudomonadota bacterium]
MRELLVLEWRRLVRERITWVLLGFLTCACILAVGQGRSVLEKQIEARNAASEGHPAAHERVVGVLKDDADPALAVLAPYWVRSSAVSSVPPLADFSAGRGPFEPHSTAMSLRSRADTLFDRTATDNPELAMRGTLDLSFVVIVLLPLVLIGFGYNLFTDDRETGLARLVLTEAGSPFRLLAVRSAPRLVVAILPILASIAVLVATGPEIDGRPSAARWWIITALGLTLFWWSFILFVNSFKISSETAALVLVSVWALFTLILPAVISAIAQISYPPPSRLEQIVAARAVQVNSTKTYENDHPEAVSDDFEGRLASIRKTLSVSREVDQALLPIADRFDVQLAGQQRLLQSLIWLSPSMLSADAFASIAGTDPVRSTEFRHAARRYLKKLKAELGGIIDRGEIMSRQQYEELPRFDWQPKASHPIRAVVWLVLSIALLLSLSFLRLRRITV